MTAPSSIAAALSEAERLVLKMTIENTATGCFWSKAPNAVAARALEAAGLLVVRERDGVPYTKSENVTALGREVFDLLPKENA